MAGDWIKVEHATVDKPEVIRLADLMGFHPDQAVGLLVRFWVWLDRNLRNDSVTLLYAKTVDSVTHASGFCGALCEIGWAEMDPKTGIVTIKNVERHNGNPAKTRALGRDRSVTIRSRERNANTVTREEKRREDIKPKALSTSPSAVDVVPLPETNGRPSKLRLEATELLDFLNAKTGRFYRPCDTTLRPIMARLKEGHDVGTCKAVIVRKWRAWKDDDKMRQYLRPVTLFGAEKFAQYVGEVPTEAENG